MEKEKEGSEFSTAILNETRYIYHAKGDEAAYQFLVAQKTRNFTEDKEYREMVSRQALKARAQKRRDIIMNSEQQIDPSRENPLT